MQSLYNEKPHLDTHIAEEESKLLAGAGVTIIFWFRLQVRQR
jgi:hypothetical protein